MMLRAEFPVHKNRTLNSRFVIDVDAQALVFAPQQAVAGAGATVAQHALAGADATVFGSATGRRSSP